MHGRPVPDLDFRDGDAVGVMELESGSPGIQVSVVDVDGTRVIITTQVNGSRYPTTLQQILDSLTLAHKAPAPTWTPPN